LPGSATIGWTSFQLEGLPYYYTGNATRAQETLALLPGNTTSDRRAQAVLARLLAEAFAEYLRCFKEPATIHATCEDYRAGATIDLEHSGEDGARRVMCPLLVLWGERGTVARLYDVMRIWRDHAVNVTGKALPAGHFLPEEIPEETLSALLSFLQS
jgi:pimeloyl-ACP methyl ester carboxylesterase